METVRQQPAAQAAAEEIVASFDTYAEAERALASLTEHEFPVERVSIVGRGLIMVERVTGRVTGLDAAVSGAGRSALWGGLLGFVFGAVGTPFAGLVLMLWGALIGIAIGALLGWLAHRVGAGRDFESLSGVRAERFDVVVEASHAAEAAALIDYAQRPSR